MLLNKFHRFERICLRGKLTLAEPRLWRYTAKQFSESTFSGGICKNPINSFQEHRFNGEKVAGQHLCSIMVQERSPIAASMVTFRCRRNVMTFNHIADCRDGDVVAQLQELALQLLENKARIFVG